MSRPTLSLARISDSYELPSLDSRRNAESDCICRGRFQVGDGLMQRRKAGYSYCLLDETYDTGISDVLHEVGSASIHQHINLASLLIVMG